MIVSDLYVIHRRVTVLGTTNTRSPTTVVDKSSGTTHSVNPTHKNVGSQVRTNLTVYTISQDGRTESFLFLWWGGGEISCNGPSKRIFSYSII